MVDCRLFWSDEELGEDLVADFELAAAPQRGDKVVFHDDAAGYMEEIHVKVIEVVHVAPHVPEFVPYVQLNVEETSRHRVDDDGKEIPYSSPTKAEKIDESVEVADDQDGYATNGCNCPGCRNVRLNGPRRRTQPMTTERRDSHQLW